MKSRKYPAGLALMLALVIVARMAPATASTVALTTSDVSGVVTPTGAPVPTLGAGSYTYARTYNVPTSIIPTTSFGFYDDYVFDIPQALANSITSTISLESLLGINNLQARLYQAPSDLTTLPILGNPTLQGLSLYEGWSTSMDYGSFTTTTAVLPLYALASGRYVLEVRGNVVGTAGGSYAGVLNIAPVPLPAGVWLLVSGLAGLAAARRRRQSVSVAHC